MKKLRLVMFEECNRACEGCCNNDWDLNGLDVNESFEGYDMVMLTGGEPMLKPDLVIETAERVRASSMAKIILYTAKSRRALDLIAVMHWLDGVTLTLHEQYDVEAFIQLNKLIQRSPFLFCKDLRLNVFSNVNIDGLNTRFWQVKDGIEWIKDCPLPEGEVIQRLWR